MVRQKQFLMPQTESQLLQEIIRAVYPYVRIHRANVGSLPRHCCMLLIFPWPLWGWLCGRGKSKKEMEY